MSGQTIGIFQDSAKTPHKDTLIKVVSGVIIDGNTPWRT